MKPNYYYYS